MRSGALAALGAMAFLLAACGWSGVSATPSPTLGGVGPAARPSRPAVESPAIPPDDSAPPPSDGSAVPTGETTRPVVLQGTFTGHGSDPLATADQTVELELHWNAGPDDIHDPKAFALVSGSFTFSESISGVCGGSRSEVGPLTPYSNSFLISGGIQDRDQATVNMVDARLSSGGVEFSPTSSYAVPNADQGCGPLSRSGVGICTMVFLQTAIGALQQEASCADASRNIEWTGRLTP